MARKSKRSHKTSTRDAAQNARSARATPFYSDVLGLAGGLLRSRQEQGSERIASLAEAARSVVNELHDVPTLQTYVESAADQLDHLSDYVAERDLEDMVGDATRFARQYPLATMAFAIAAGFGFTRIMAHNARENARTTAAPRRTTVRRGRKGAGVRAKANGAGHASRPVHAS
jgi:hypothetical protein